MNDNLPSTASNSADKVTAFAKGVLGAVPFVGPMAAEIVGAVIPNQRVDRLVRFFELLEERVKHLEQASFYEKCLEQDSVDLIEDALLQSARAKSEERLNYIADIVANGLVSGEKERLESQKMLWLLEKVSNIEVILLRGQLPGDGDEYRADAKFQTTHNEILKSRALDMGSSDEEFDEEALYSSFKMHLVDLTLLRPNFRKPRRGEFPEFDHRTGKMKASGHAVTRLGKMLLRQLKLMPEWLEPT